MPSYTTIRRYHEDGVGQTDVVFILSDSYAGLYDVASAVETGIFRCKSVKKDLDIDRGVFAVDECAFDVDETAINSTDDQDALAFLRAAEDPDVERFVGILINPAAPPVETDFDFRGRVSAEMDADDVQWSGTAWSGTISPVRRWKCRAYSFDASYVLEQDTEAVIDAIEQTWIDANVHDKVGPYSRDDQYGHRELVYRDLVPFETLIQGLLDAAVSLVSQPITLTYQATESDLYVWPAKFQPLVIAGLPLRCSTRQEGTGIAANPAPFVMHDSDQVQLKLGGAAGTDRCLLVNWRLLQPSSDEEGYSWKRFTKLNDLLYMLAANFNSYLRFEPQDANEIVVRFAPSSEIGSEEIYFRDAVQARLRLRPVEPTANDRYAGVGNQWLSELGRQVNWDGSYYAGREDWRAGTQQGQLLPLTINPSWILLQGAGGDLHPQGSPKLNYLDVGGRAWALMPHNAMYQGDTWLDDLADGNVAFDRSGLHSALYIRVPAWAGDGMIGVAGTSVVCPVGIAQAYIDGQWTEVTDLATLLNRLRRLDQRYYAGSYELDLPGLMVFRDDPLSTADWRPGQPAKRITLDGVSFVVRSVERQYDKVSTSLGLEARERHSVAGPPPPQVLPGGATPTAAPPADRQPPQVREMDAGDGAEFGKWDVLRRDASGHLHRADTTRTSYRSVVGFALAAYDGVEHTTERIPVHTGGTLEMGFDPGLPVGAPVFLRDIPVPGWNVSASELATRNGNEVLHLRLGYVEAPGVIRVEFGEEWLFE